MTTKRIVWRRPDGSVSITVPTEPQLEGESEAIYLDRVAMRFLSSHPDHATYQRLDATGVDVADLPQSRRFRNCWRHEGQAVGVSLPLARQQVLAEVRAERDAKLPALDVQWSRAAARKQNSEADAVEAKRQALRDLPAVVAADLEAINNAESLAAYRPVWPDGGAG